MAAGYRSSRPRLIWSIKLALGVLLFWIAFRDVDPTALGRAFRTVHPAWLTASVLSTFLTVGLVMMRWRVLLGAAAEPRHAPLLFAAVIASQVANIVMPFKLGDAVRIGAVSRGLRVPVTEVLGSVAVERLFDALTVAMTAGLLVAAGTLPAFARAGMLSLMLGIGAALVAALLVLKSRGTVIRSTIGRSRALPDGARPRIARHVDLLLRGLQRVSRPRAAGAALVLSAAVMASSVLTAWSVLRAFDLGAPAISAAVIVIAVQIGGVVVPVPGAVGVSQVLTVQTLALWGIPEAPALAYALMLYLVSRVPKLAVLPFALSVLSVPPQGEWPELKSGPAG